MLPLLPACAPIGPWNLDTGDVDPVRSSRVVVSPASLDFGTVSVNADGVREAEFTLFNLGDVTETVAGHDEPLGDEAFTVAADPLLPLAPGEELTLTVTFAPTTDADYRAELLIQTSVAGESLAMLGTGTAPVLSIGELSFEPTVLGCTGTGSLAVANHGSEPLAFEGTLLESDEFSIASEPGTLAPGEVGTFGLRFTPAGGGQRGATLIVGTNDPLHPERSVTMSVLGYEGERVTEQFRYTPSNPTDILFVVEAGAALADHADKVAIALPTYVDAIRDSNLDYQLAALSSEDPCPASTPGYATRSDTTLQTESILERGFFGDGGRWDADLLGLALAALDTTVPSGCLDGFRRSNADLQVILVSDGPSSASVPSELAALADWTDDSARLRLGALVPTSADCGDYATDYITAVTTLEGDVADLCADDWTRAFETFAELPAGSDAVRFELAEPPVVATIEVRVEGSTWREWSYEHVANAIVFDAASVPPLGAEVTLRYVSSVACE